MRVLLVHGLARTPLSFLRLRRQLSAAGHDPEFFAWLAAAEPYEQIRRRLIGRLRAMTAAGQPVGLVGHSMGGLLLRHALADVPELKVHHFIMLGTPNQPPRRAQRAIHWLPWRLLTRSCGEMLASPTFEQIPPPAVPYTVVAGTAGPRLLSGPFGDELHDGLVSVGETRVRDGDVPVLLPVGHTFMMNDSRLSELVLQLLR